MFTPKNHGWLQRLMNHKKKIVFFSAAAAWSTNYVKQSMEERQILLEYCCKAKKYGDEPISRFGNIRKISVLINKDDDFGQAKRNFEKYALPLFHFAGLDIEIINCNSNEFPAEQLNLLRRSQSDTLYIVGGDEIISKTVNNAMKSEMFHLTQLKMKYEFPVLAFFPVGGSNCIAKTFFSPMSSRVKNYCESAMAVIDGKCQYANCFKYKVGEEEEESIALGYVYCDDATGVFETKYRFFRRFQEKLSALYYTLTHKVHTKKLEVSYVEPCAGCSKCSVYKTLLTPQQHWWHKLIGTRSMASSSTDKVMIDDQAINLNCGEEKHVKVSTVVFKLANDLLSDDPPKMDLSVGPKSITRWQFLNELWKRSNSDNAYSISSDFQTLLAGRSFRCHITSPDEITLVVDGKKLPSADISVEIFPHLIQVLVPK
ncbi:Uncharacterized protein T4B_10767 [Trichinella pseudospiralis]|uniref:DAGKc domain-containing protein n=1 Tax=Trichinella pseudospiralis TaxID=6337 RepID=A0A0V1HWJ6_TRIPS|nr:Uncharacterized protein T4A_1626 [Trichinella pseudospiralis]KRZ14953.1 Uncharacterized protein T4B_10767 [Trichinella pseudospiralis]KRZ26658.1 Uncharacterized protein T4C_7908 [Trichinella pseudospiralis]